MFKFRWEISLWFSLNSSNSGKKYQYYKLWFNLYGFFSPMCPQLIHFYLTKRGRESVIFLGEIPSRNFLFSSSSLCFCLWNTVTLNNTAIFTGEWSIILLLLLITYLKRLLQCRKSEWNILCEKILICSNKETYLYLYIKL